MDMAGASTTAAQVYRRCCRAGERFAILTELEPDAMTNQDNRGRKRRASTGSVMGTGRHPPSEVKSKMVGGRSRMQMRFPVSVLAMLSVGLEVEFMERRCAGVRFHVRWQNYDGERHWKWTNFEGTPCARSWQTYVVQRMVWARRDDPSRWHGGWVWEAYDRDWEWDEHGHGTNRYWLDMGNVSHSAPVPSRGVDVPVEVLRYMLEGFHWVCAAISFAIEGSHF